MYPADGLTPGMDAWGALCDQQRSEEYCFECFLEIAGDFDTPREDALAARLELLRTTRRCR